MIAKCNLHDNGGALAAYLVKGEPGHRAELVEMRGFAAENLRDAFRDVEIQARGTHAKAPFLHCYTRLPVGEALTPEQWEYVADRQEKRLHMTGQPRVIAFHHLPDGSTHMHIAWSRIALAENGKLFAIDPGLYKNTLKYLCRDLEKEYGLKEVSNDRKPGNRARAPDRKEVEESRRLGTDGDAIRTTILDCLEKADSGKALMAALKTQGLELAYGDKRDVFVVVDRAGGQHTLKKKLTGLTLEETRQRLSDIDRTKLPSIEQAQAMQRDRQAERKQAKQREPDKRPPGQTASQIREASASNDFARGLKERGLILAYVTPEAVKESQRAKAIAKAAGRQNRVLKEGFAVVDQRSNVSRIDARTAGKHLEKVQAQLAQIDRSQLPSVAEARAQMKELNRARLEKKGTERKTVHSLEAEQAAVMSQLAQLHRDIAAAGKRTTEPVAVNFDRDKADAEWMNRLDKAAIETQIEKEKAAHKSRERSPEKEPDAAAASGKYADLKTPAAEPAREPVPGKPLGKTAGAMCMAWSLSRSAEQLEDALAAHGISLAVASREDAETSKRPVTVQSREGKTYEPWMMQTGGVSGLSDAYRESAESSYQKWSEINPEAAAKHDFADYVQYVQGKWADEERRPEDRPGNRRPAFKEGEIVAVDGRGNVYRFDERTTGEKNPDIDARFPGIDRAALMSVTDTQEAMKEASLAAWKAERAAEREAARPASWLENRIAECAGQSGLYATVTRDKEGRAMARADILADKLDGWRAGIEAAGTGEPNTYQQKGVSVTVYGKEAFAARCEEAGISIVRVTASDTIALDALRREEYMQRLSAETNREAYKGNRFAPLEAGELAAVTRGGDVYRINAEKLGDAANMLAEKLPGVIETRDAVMDDRTKTERLWEQWRTERTTDRETKATERESRAAGAQDRREERQTAREIGAALDKGFGIARKLAEKVIKLWESSIDVLFGWAMAPAPLTRQQVHDKRQAQGNVETLHAEAVAEMRQAHDNARDEQISEADRQRNIREAELYSRFGYILNQPDQPREIQRDGGRERERERDA